MTTLDGYPMAQKGKARKALKLAHISSASGDTFSDIVLIFCAPFLAVLVERYLDLPEKTALLILSLAFIASVIGGLLAKAFDGAWPLAAYIGTEKISVHVCRWHADPCTGVFVTTATGGVDLGRSVQTLEKTFGKNITQLKRTRA